MNKKTISVVLPNYNGKDLLESNLPSIYKALDKGSFSYELIVADDCSTDDSINFLKTRYPEIKIYENDKNSGFAVTCNLGIKNADSIFVCVTNTDVTFDENYFIFGMKCLEEENIFAVKGDIFNYKDDLDNVINVDRTTRMYFKKGFLRFRTGFEPGEEHTDILEYAGLGCCFLCRADILKSLGGFDEIFAPYYWEDSDIAIRAINKGYRIEYVPECIVYHKFSSTMGLTQTDFKRKLVSTRNKFLFAWRHMTSFRQWFFHLLLLVISLCSRWIVLDFKYYFSCFWAIYRAITFRKLASTTPL